MARKARDGRCANGPGWGGPAKGAGSGSARHKNFEPGNPGGRGGNAPTDRTLLKRARADALEDRLFSIAMGDVDATSVAVQAGTRLHAIYEGLPVARQELTGAGGGPIETRRLDFSHLTPDQKAALAGAIRKAGKKDDTE